MNSQSPTARVVVTLATLLFTLSLSNANAQESNASPAWLQEAMAKESRKLRSSKIAVGDGFFSSRLAGKSLAGPQAIDGGWYISSDIDTPSPLECWVFSTTIDPATMAANIANVTMQASAQAHGQLGNQSIHYVDAGSYDNAPYLALEWLYTVGEAPKALAGLAKVRVATLNGVTLACAHNFLGYRETFAKAFEEFLRKADVSNGERSHDYEEVLVHKIGEQPVGVSHSTITRDAEGDLEILIVESSLIPVNGSTLSTSDTWHSSFSRADGSLINQISAKSENGALTMQLSLDPLEDGSWLVSGTFQGKEISEEIAEPARPISEVGQMYAVRDLVADDSRSNVTLDVWVPDADPTRFLEASVAMVSGKGKELDGTLMLGPLAIAATFDKSGSLLNGRMQAGQVEMVLERVWVDGALP